MTADSRDAGFSVAAQAALILLAEHGEEKYADLLRSDLERLAAMEQRARDIAEGRVKAFGFRVRTDDVGAALYILGEETT